jgi:PAS domain S-box-containing protein
MLGYSRDDLVGLDWRKLTPPDWAQSSQVVAEELRNLGRAKPYEKEYFRKDGSRVPVLVGVATIRGGQAISVSVDLAERKRAADALTHLEAQLRQAQ